MSNEDIPRRIRIDRMTEAERAIFEAAQFVEGLPADPRLTDAVVLLGAARDAVADYVDGVEGVTRSVSLHRHVSVAVASSGTDPW